MSQEGVYTVNSRGKKSYRYYYFDIKGCFKAEIFARRHASGRPISQVDCQISAIALSREAAIATRNIADFAGIEVELINPWSRNLM